MSDRGPWFQTASGRAFFPHHPEPEDVFLSDIARGLSMQCRFNGQCNSFYSVATHSLLISLRVAPVEELDVLKRATSAIGRAAYVDLVHLGLVGLMHDAAEAYVGDLVSPIKHVEALRPFRDIENQIARAISMRFDYLSYSSGNKSYETAPVVKEADRRMLLTEKRDLRQPGKHGTAPWKEEAAGLSPYEDLKLRGESPERAEELFLERFHELWQRKTGSGWDDEIEAQPQEEAK